MFGVRKLRKEIGEMKASIALATDDISSVAMLMRNTQSEPTSYNTRERQVSGMKEKYQGRSNYGNHFLQRCVNLRVAFSIPNRLFLIRNPVFSGSDTAVQAAKDFLYDFLSYTELDSSMPRDLAKESEIEGQIATEVYWDKKENMASFRYYPWSTCGYKLTKQTKHKYEILSDLELTFDDTDIGNVTVAPENLVFIAFNDLLQDYTGYPTCGAILKVIDNLAKDVEDWRNLNFLYAHPTPHFQCETQDEVNKIQSHIASTGWKVGTAIATGGEFALKGPSGVEAQMLMNSLQANVKIISGHTGIGVHFLGFANVLSNRSTADSMGEPTEVVLHSEITSWRGFYTKMFRRAIQLRNDNLNRRIEEDAVLPWLVPLTDRQWDVVKNIMMPAADKGMVSMSTFLSSIPGIDAEEEMTKIEEQESKNHKKKASMLKIASSDDEDEKGENNGKNIVPGKEEEVA